jgi:hypothetical protein
MTAIDTENYIVVFVKHGKFNGGGANVNASTIFHHFYILPEKQYG